AVAFSPDGKRALSASADFTARMWNVDTGQVIHVLRGHSDLVWDVRFSPDGKLAATGAGWQLDLTRTSNGVPRFKMGTKDCTIRLWDVQTGEPRGVLRGHSEMVKSVIFTPDSRFILSGSMDGTVRMWDVAKAKHVRLFTGHTNGVNCVAVSPDSRYALSGSW